MNTKTHTVGTVPKPNQYKLLPSGSLQMVSNDLFVYKFVHSIVLHIVDSCIVVGTNIRALVSCKIFIDNCSCVYMFYLLFPMLNLCFSGDCISCSGGKEVTIFMPPW